MTDDLLPTFESVAEELLRDPDDDVSLTATGLHVHDRLFAYPDTEGLVVDLPRERAEELVGREVAEPVRAGRSEPRGAWVRIGDAQDWPELAAEAHQFVGEPAVGRES